MLQLLIDWKDSESLWIIYKDSVRSNLKKIGFSFIDVFHTKRTTVYNQYNDVVIVDSTYNMNQFQMILCVISVVDNNYKTRIVACAIIEDETLDTYQWIFDSILIETGIAPHSDSDPSLIRSIKNIYLNTQHIFHI